MLSAVSMHHVPCTMCCQRGRCQLRAGPPCITAIGTTVLSAAVSAHAASSMRHDECAARAISSCMQSRGAGGGTLMPCSSRVCQRSRAERRAERPGPWCAAAVTHSGACSPAASLGPGCHMQSLSASWHVLCHNDWHQIIQRTRQGAHVREAPAVAPSTVAIWAHCPATMRVSTDQADIPGTHVRGAPAVAPSPVSTLSTPAGRPASWAMAASSRHVRLAISLGLRMQQLPAASAGATFHCRGAGGRGMC